MFSLHSGGPAVSLQDPRGGCRGRVSPVQLPPTDSGQSLPLAGRAVQSPWESGRPLLCLCGFSDILLLSLYGNYSSLFFPSTGRNRRMAQSHPPVSARVDPSHGNRREPLADAAALSVGGGGPPASVGEPPTTPTNKGFHHDEHVSFSVGLFFVFISLTIRCCFPLV